MSLSTRNHAMIPSSRERVPRHTAPAVNRQIQRDIETRVSALSGDRLAIEKRLRELDHEWDIERAIEMNAAALAFAGTALGVAHDRRWLALPLFVTGFLFQHAVQGWCPPVPVLRRLGFRTVYEIEQERRALLALISRRRKPQAASRGAAVPAKRARRRRAA
jgi:hypothetical protein